MGEEHADPRAATEATSALAVKAKDLRLNIVDEDDGLKGTRSAKR
jgi:hypothetical protein